MGLGQIHNEPRRWKLKPGGRDPGFRFCAELGVSPLLARLLVMRNLSDVSAARAYLEPSLKGLCDPDALPEMELATERLCGAIRGGEEVLLYGDYDVDGITGTAVLQRVLTALGAKVRAHIPDRFTDGYGLRVEPLERIVAGGADPAVVVTIDNGCVAFEAADHLRSEGRHLIVADHHRMEEGRLPEAQAVIHPKRQGSRYPNKNLCGAGVAFKLAWATARRFEGGGKLPPKLRALLLESIAFVAMGTVADVMSLTGENRIFVRYGLQALEAGPTPGLQSLLDIARPKRPFNASTISFRLAPRINAAGRLGAGRRALDLLNAEDKESGDELAKVLDTENDARREIERGLAEQAITQVEDIYGPEPRVAGIVAADEGWHEGVVGIVASRLVERFHRPSIVLAVLEDGRAKGSGRGSFGVDLKAALDDCAELLTGYGGHEAAVGLQLPAENVDAFREAFGLAVARQMGVKEGAEVEVEPPELKIDLEVELREITETLCVQLQKLEPHGIGNPKPTFSSTVTISGSPRIMGKDGSHLSFFVTQDGLRARCVFWGGAQHYDALDELARRPRSHDRRLRIAFRAGLNEFRGQRNIELVIQDLHLEV